MGQDTKKFPWWGVDGCKGGWLWVGLNADGEACELVRREFADAFAEARARGAESVLVDIPIGLRSDAHERDCDQLARKLIGKRGRSVFRVPCRQAIEVYGGTKDEEKAKRENKKITGKILSLQTWGIAPKIYEVDDFLRRCNLAKKIVREIHPEVCFRAFNDAALQYSKKDSQGRKERHKILKRYLDTSKFQEHFRKICSRYQKKIVENDDIYDALVAALTAKVTGQCPQTLKTLPPAPLEDHRGLPMEMVYYGAD